MESKKSGKQFQKKNMRNESEVMWRESEKKKINKCIIKRSEMKKVMKWNESLHADTNHTAYKQIENIAG